MEDGEKLLLSLQEQHLPGSSCCPGWALLSPTTLTGDCTGGAVQQVSLHHMSHCRAFTSSPVLLVFLCFPAGHIPPLPMSCLWAQSRIFTDILEAGQPQLPASSSCCSSASSRAGTSMEQVSAASLYLQHKQTETSSSLCCVWAVPLPFALSPTGD